MVFILNMRMYFVSVFLPKALERHVVQLTVTTENIATLHMICNKLQDGNVVLNMWERETGKI